MSEREKKTFRLGEFVTLKRGYDLPVQARGAGAYPVVSSSGVSGSHGAFKVEGPGVVTGRYGTLGEVFYIPGRFWPLNTSLYVQDFKGNDPKFVYYYLQTVLSANFNAAGAVPGVNRNTPHKLKVPKPPEAQQKIAAVLSAYDDLIENNKRRIVVLEKIAEEIYREWFVRMRFPGYEKTKFVKGVPEGWKVSTLGDLANFTMGQSPKSEFYNEAGEGLPFNQGVGTYGDRFPKRITYCSSDGRKAKEHDILFSVRAPVGRLNIADCEMIIGRGLAAIRHKQDLNSYLFYLLKVAFTNEDIIGNGAIFNAVGKNELAKFKLFKPEDNLILKFEEIANRVDRQIELLISSSKCLISTRAFLLPRLLSGKLSVEDLDIRFPSSMQQDMTAA